MNNGIPFRPACLIVLGLAVGLWVCPARGQHPDFPEVDPLPGRLDTLADDEVKDIVLRLCQKTAEIAEAFREKARRASLEREVLAEQLAATKSYAEAPPEDIRLLEEAVKEAQKAEKTALTEGQKAERLLTEAHQLAGQPPRSIRKGLPKLHKRVMALLPPPPERPIAEILEGAVVQADTSRASAPAAELPPATASADKSPDPPSPPAAPPRRVTFKKYQPAADVLLHPPPRPCVLVTDTRDEFSGERRRETPREELFRYTNPSLRPYLQGREHIVCHASVSQNGALYLLQLSFTLSDANAKRTFGGLPKNSLAVFKLLNGETLSLVNMRADEGRAGDDKITHTFVGQYLLDATSLKKLQKVLLDKVRIAWATGYEDYEIHEVDLLVRHLNCLLK